jgi:hypothetical protein
MLICSGKRATPARSLVARVTCGYLGPAWARSESQPIPARGRLSGKRTEHQKQRWFRRALRWRAGIERTLSHLKHPFSMARARYKGESGFQRYVGWCVISKNLFSIARWQELRKLEPRGRTMSKSIESSVQRRKLLDEIRTLADIAVFGTYPRPIAPVGGPAAIASRADPSMIRT